MQFIKPLVAEFLGLWDSRRGIRGKQDVSQLVMITPVITTTFKYPAAVG